MERLSTIFVVAGVLFFAFAFVTLGLGPWLALEEVKARPLAIAEVPHEFQDVFKDTTSYEEGLRQGRDIYVAEGCWHCHSQYVRPVGNEATYYGPVSTAAEYQTELQLPQLLGTRRVGPDLIRESKRHSRDWHVAHFFDPQSVVPSSVMPGFVWYFDENEKPKQELWSLIAYVMYLGSWAEVPDELDLLPEITRDGEG